MLEVLIAVAILGLLMVGLTQGVRNGLGLRQAQAQRLTETAELDAAMRLLRSLLSRLPVVPEGNRLVATEKGAGFKGEPNRISFIADMPTGLGAIRRADITLFVREGELLLAWGPHRHERSLGQAAAPQEVQILRGVRRLEVAYWGAPGSGRAVGWQPSWFGISPPALVRLRLGFAASDSRRWPDLIAAPGL